MSDELASDSDNEKQLLRARRKQLLIRKNKRVLSKKIERSSFERPSLPPPSFTSENTSNLLVDHRQAAVVAFGAINTDQKFVNPVEKKDIFNTFADFYGG